uniref:Methyltransf_11 domain-containing protein n=1 Tax=Angiostrongylus cantonensis TaxID=6313 RepID=A0A0K0D4S2_ANGCA
MIKKTLAKRKDGKYVGYKDKPSIIVTLGIGQDTTAEEALLKVLPKSSKFYGVDPVHEVNEELYAKFGKFFPFAVGGKSKVSRASVLANGKCALTF